MNYQNKTKEEETQQKVLSESEEKYKLLFDNVADAIFIIDPSGKILSANQSACKEYGYSYPELISLHIQDIDTPEHSIYVKERISKLLQQGSVIFQSVNQRKDKSILDVEVHSSKIILNGQDAVLSICRNITEHKRANDILLQTRHNYETFFNTIDEFLFVLDEQGNIIHTNSTVIDRLGYTREELAGLSVLMVHPAERRDEAARIVSEMLNGVSTFCPVPIVTKSGTKIPVETRVSHGFWNGKPAIFGVTKDISKVRLSEEKFSKLFHLNPSACGLSDLDNHQYIEVNEAFYTLFGFDKNEVIGKTATDLGILTPETINAIMLKADSNGIVTNAEADLIAKCGDIKHVLLSSENIYVQDKEFRITVVHDITERKQVEKTLQNERLLLRTVIDNIPDSIYVKDLTCRKTLANIAEVQYMGAKSESEVIGTDDFGFYPLDLAKIFFADDQAVLQTGKPMLNREGYILDRKNQKRYLRSSKLPLRDNNNQIIGLVGISHDITNRKQAELEIKLKIEELKIANSEKDKFFSIIAHDLRSPFNAFLGFTRMMVEELNTMSLEEIRTIVISMRKSATNLYSLLENLLEWSMMQRGIIAYHPVSIPLALKIKESLEFIIGSVKKKEIEISIDIPDGLSVFADVHMVESLIRNLISNAAKFTPKKGKITVSANKIEGNFIEIVVRDTGIGMRKELLSKLFILDEQTGRKGTEGEPSTGLGLLICKDFVEKHGGKIWVESTEGKGSAFYFTLPGN